MFGCLLHDGFTWTPYPREGVHRATARRSSDLRTLEIKNWLVGETQAAHVELPRDQRHACWIEKWYDDPVFPLVSAFYGHPLSGIHLEIDYTKVLFDD